MPQGPSRAPPSSSEITVNTGTVLVLPTPAYPVQRDRLGAPTVERSRTGRSRRSTSSRGEPGTWGSAAAVIEKEGRHLDKFDARLFALAFVNCHVQDGEEDASLVDQQGLYADGRPVVTTVCSDNGSQCTDCFTDCLPSVPPILPAVSASNAVAAPSSRARTVALASRSPRSMASRISLNWRAVVATVSLSITCRPPPAAGRGSGRPGGRGGPDRPGATT